MFTIMNEVPRDIQKKNQIVIVLLKDEKEKALVKR